MSAVRELEARRGVDGSHNHKADPADRVPTGQAEGQPSVPRLFLDWSAQLAHVRPRSDLFDAVCHREPGKVGPL